MRTLTAGLTTAGMVLTMLFAGPAVAAGPPGFYVTGVGDPAGAACRPYAVAGYVVCDSVRAAVAAANAGHGGDIYLTQPGTYTLTEGPLTISNTFETSIHGINARATTLDAGGRSRVLDIAAGAHAALNRLTVSGGRAPAGEGGGNVRNRGYLVAADSRFTRGSAAFGGGIDNQGVLYVARSLIDHNTAAQSGGGVFASGLFHLDDSTIAFNGAGHGGGVGVAPGGPGLISRVTIARNTSASAQSAGGIEAGRAVIIDSSIVAANRGSAGALTNCKNNSGPIFNSGGNFSDGPDCMLFVESATIGLSAQLVDAGGGTDVLTIPPTSAAKRVGQCDEEDSDQRSARRTSDRCDSGAFEEGAVAPALTAEPFALPAAPAVVMPPPPPPPQPAAPHPVLNRSLVIGRSGGRVLFRRPGSSRLSELAEATAIPVGSTVYAKNGYVRVTSVPKLGAPAQSVVFWGGDFKLTQSRGVTEMVLTEKLGCRQSRRRGGAPALPRRRQLYGQGVAPFRIRGAYATATNRSSRWLVRDTCTSTRIRATGGTVRVNDRVKHRSVLLRAGRTYTARRR